MGRERQVAHRRWAAIALAVVPLLIAASGCSKLREKLAGAKSRADAGAELAVVLGDADTPVPVPAPSASEPAVVKTTTGMKVPEDFPASVPPYPGSKVTAAVTNEKGDTKSHVLVLQTHDSADTVAAFYLKSMRRAKQTIDMTAGKTRMLTFHDAASALDVALTITPEKDHTTINLTVAPSR